MKFSDLGTIVSHVEWVLSIEPASQLPVSIRWSLSIEPVSQLPVSKFIY